LIPCSVRLTRLI